MMKVMNNNNNNNMNSLREDINNGMSSFKEDVAVSMSHLREDLNSNISQSNELICTRMESLQKKIALRAASRTSSRTVSPGALAVKLHVKVKDDTANIVLETPRVYAPPEDVTTMTTIIKSDAGIIINPLTVQEKVELRTTASIRSSSQAAGSKHHLALRLTVTAPAIEIPVLMRPEPYLTVPNIEGSSTMMEPILFATIITVLELPQSFEAMIEVPVRTTTSLYDITPSNKSDHAFEAMSLDGKPNVDADEYNDINDQHTNSTHQPEQPCSIFNSDNSNYTSSQVPNDNFRRIGIDVSYESKQVDPNNFNNQRATMEVIETIYYGSQYTGKTRDEATLYSDCGTMVHTPIPPIPMVLIY